ncbi:MAG: pilus assembly protein TadG-related protein [Acetobacteraceae bacterium]|nr:pilus assembly protein TadG-related protein [Acetobacteraceae bacterium]
MIDLGAIGARVSERTRRALRLLRSRRGGVSIMVAVAFPVMIAMAGLVTEYGDGLMVRQKAQQMADIAALSGATTYNVTSTVAALNAAVARVALLNGFATSAVTPAVVKSPSGDGNNAVLVTVNTSVTLGLSSLVRSGSNLPISASSYVEIKPSGGQSCIVGLATSGNSIQQDGGSTLRGTNCAVAAKNNFSISGGANMTVLGVYAGGTVTNTGGASITTTPTANNIVPNYPGISDPVASNTALQAAFTGLSSLGGTVTTPSNGATLNFQYQSCPNGSDAACAYYSSSGNFTQGTLPCSSGSYAISSITVAGGVNVHISATPGCNYTIAGGISVGGGSLLQIDGAAGSWYINGGVTTGGNSTTGLTANKYRVSGTVALVGTVNWLTAGAGPTVQFLNAVSLGNGGGTFTFGDGTYSVNGSLTLSSGPTYFGNSLLSINGNLLVSSGASLCGEPAPCGSGTSTMTIVDNGSNTFAGGSTANIAAPSSSAIYGIPGITIASNYANTSGYQQVFSGGTNGTYAGVVYFPGSNVQLSGGASTGGSNCFEIVANAIYISGGSTTASTCSGFGANVGPSIAQLIR